jgi:hypothetical protein
LIHLWLKVPPFLPLNFKETIRLLLLENGLTFITFHIVSRFRQYHPQPTPPAIPQSWQDVPGIGDGLYRARLSSKLITSFAFIWEYIQANQKPCVEIRNWNAFSGYLGDKMTITKFRGRDIEVDTSKTMFFQVVQIKDVESVSLGK